MNDSGGNYYFLPHDVDPNNLRRSGARGVEFDDVVKRLPSKVLLMVDEDNEEAYAQNRRVSIEIAD